MDMEMEKDMEAEMEKEKDTDAEAETEKEMDADADTDTEKETDTDKTRVGTFRCLPSQIAKNNALIGGGLVRKPPPLGSATLPVEAGGWFSMSKTALIFGALALVLAGCAGRITEQRETHRVGDVCAKYIGSHDIGVEADPNRSCPDGSSPKLQYLQWITESGNCEPKQTDAIRGGIAGIRRVYWCGK
jgi:hypothetical protein